MTRTALILIAAIAGTSAAAGQSDRYHDTRLDTSISAADRPSSHSTKSTATPQTTFSSKSDASGKPYAYQNRFGVGPNNDSR